MIYKENFKIGLKDVWKNSQISNVAILEYLEDIAAYHSDSVGYGVNTTNETNFTWILLDWKVKVIKRPIYGQILDIHTWSRKIVKCYAYRDFEVYNQNGDLCVIASSKWLLINNKEGKIAKVGQEMADKYESEIGKCVFDDSEIDKLKAPDKFNNEILYKVQRKDIDVIGHMHNLYYLNLANEALPEDVYNQKQFDNIRIMYKKEIKLGEIVRCKYAYVENKHVIVIESEDKNVVHSIIELY